MEWFSALEVAKCKKSSKDQPKCLPISRDKQNQEISIKHSKDFQGINSSKEEVSGRSHHI
jgi:hypothetical protein